MYISSPVFAYERLARSLAGRVARPIYQGLGGLHGTHSASKSFPDPNECWRPGSAGQPDLSKTLLIVEAALEIPTTCTGPIIAKTTLRDKVPAGGAVDYANGEMLWFGVSDGTNTGGLERATRISEKDGVVEFTKGIQWDGNSCTASNDIFVYVKYRVRNTLASSYSIYTFIEIGFYPRVASNRGVPIDRSPNPAIRLNPCNHLTPIRSPYIHGKESERYLKLPQSVRTQVIKDTDSVFREETGVARKLDLNKPKDRLLANHWLRIRDSVMIRGYSI
jgi:hypothetical protein